LWRFAAAEEAVSQHVLGDAGRDASRKDRAITDLGPRDSGWGW